MRISPRALLSSPRFPVRNNKLQVKFPSISQNETLARSIVSFFALQLYPTVADISDIKTAVSEAVTNCVVHAYPDKVGEIIIECEIVDNSIHITVSDNGIGIDDVSKALKPLYTTKSENERSGMGFTIMQSFMDKVDIYSESGKGTTVYMQKRIIGKDGENNAKSPDT